MAYGRHFNFPCSRAAVAVPALDTCAIYRRHPTADTHSYTEKPKYRCPRCKAQTCSLACYKRHQQRASCSGQRDPAAYLKKSQWATANGIDQDYNYLKGVERNINRAGKDVANRGIGVENLTSRNVARGWRVDSVLQRYLIENRIGVQHAPRGMSRQKFNQTRPTKKNRIVWTVEWIDGAGSSNVRHDNSESDNLVDLYDMLQRQKLREDRTSSKSNAPVAENGRSLKRKRKDIDADSEAQPDEQTKESPIPHVNLETDQEALDKDADSRGSIVDIEADGASNDHQDPDSANEEQVPPTISDAANELAESDVGNVRIKVEPTEQDDRTEDPTTAANDGMVSSQHQPEPQFFYLLRPSTESSSRVLIPRKPGNTLTEAIRDEVVLEYPTIYVLPKGPESLPDGFILEKDYLRGLRNQESQVSLLSDPIGMPTESTSSAQPIHGQVELSGAQHILEMLRRDVTR